MKRFRNKLINCWVPITSKYHEFDDKVKALIIKHIFFYMKFMEEQR